MPGKCKNCGREWLDHKARDFACPLGRKTRAGHIHYHKDQFYSEKERTVKKKKPKRRKKEFGYTHWTDGSRIAACTPYGSVEWETTTDINEVTCRSCLRVIKSRNH